MGDTQPLSLGIQRSTRPRPFGVTLIALYEFFLVALIIYGLWIAFSAHFARGPGASGRDPLEVYFAEIFIFSPLSLICHIVAGVGLWLLFPTGRIVRMTISSLNVLGYWQGGMLILIEYLPQRQPDLRTVCRVLALDILIFCYLEFYPEIREKFGYRVPS